MIQDIKDEVLDVSLQPDIEPRYTIKDNNGNILNDNVRIELKTPVIGNGTPLNRATMANLQGDLYTQDRYNVPTYSDKAMTLDLSLTSYETGKVIRIKAPATLANPTININNLGEKLINGTINANKYYNLVYDGVKFILEKTTINVSEADIVITSSGTYSLDPEIEYRYSAVGGGGGADSAYYWPWSTKGGGGGGLVTGTIPVGTSSITVTIGGAGFNTFGYYGSSRPAGDGGNTTILGDIAYGGKAGVSNDDYADELDETQGIGGDYLGTQGRKGNDGVSSSNSIGDWQGTGGAGLITVGNVTYGNGGTLRTNGDRGIELNTAPTQGVIVLTPLL